MADEISVVVRPLVASTLSECLNLLVIGPPSPTRRWLTPRRPPRCCLETSLPLVCKLLELSRHGISRYAREHRGLSWYGLAKILKSPDAACKRAGNIAGSGID